MEYSELLTVLKTEASGIKANAIDFFKFINHFYGCISVLEMLGESEFDSLVDISNIAFEDIGSHYGFYTSEYSLKYVPHNTIYRSIWESIWKKIGEKRNTDSIDKLEDDAFAIILAFEKLRGLTFFKNALSQQSLTAEQNLIIQDLLASGISEEKPEASQEIKSEKSDEIILAKPEPRLTSSSSAQASLAKPEPHLAKPEKTENLESQKPVIDYKVLPEKVKKYRRTRRHNNISPMSSNRITAITHKKKKSASHQA
jgi:hypothetical protein